MSISQIPGTSPAPDNADVLIAGDLPIGVLFVDSDFHITYCNTHFSAVTGFPINDVKNKLVSVLYVNEDDLIKVSYELSEARKRGVYKTEDWKRKKDGSKFWCSTTISFKQTNAGHQYIYLIENAEARRLRDGQLRKSEERYRLMVEGVKDYSIFMLDPTGIILTWNEGAQKNQGYYANEIIGKHFSVFYTHADLKDKKPEMEIEIATRTGKYEEEGWRVKKNGSVFWASIVLTSLYNEQNELVGFSKVTRDISEKKFSDENLRQSEERYRSLVEQVLDYGIFLLDDRGRIVSWNEGARRIKGYTHSEIIGKYFSIFYPEEEILNGKPAMELRVARETGKYEEEGWRVRKDGSRFWANVVITAVYNSENVLIGFSKVTRDLTERKQSEKALRDSYENYRCLADQLSLTNRELTAANKELEQFTSIVSHDLQEPLRTIKSFLKLLEIKLLNQDYSDVQSYLSKTYKAADRMKLLIQNLLDYSQLDKIHSHDDAINSRELVDEALQLLSDQIEISRAKVNIRCVSKTVKGDKIQLARLIQNLVSNALKFVDDKNPVIDINCSETDSYFLFSVADNGIGIREDERQKVFEIFRRLKTDKAYPGTGIGLAICKKIVDKHKGNIWIESYKGSGTVFYFTIKKR